MATTDKPDERQIVCSGCLQVFPESLINVIPYFNSDVGGYVATYRCEGCWVSSLEETRTRLASTENEAEISSAADLFERHGVVLHEFRRGDPMPVVRKRLCQMLDLLQSRVIRLAVGRVQPLDATAPDLPKTAALVPDEETAQLRAALEKYERLGEEAYDAMSEARSFTAKDSFDDARGYFLKAIAAAKRASLAAEVARLSLRLDHIVSVYNHQIRGVGR
jgi:hypothetical protein